MRIHVQNPETAGEFDITEAQVVAAGGAGHALSFGRGAADFAAGCADAEVLVVGTAVLRGLLPISAPHLRVVFITAAGAERLAPFDWLPPGVMLINNSGVHGPKLFEYALMALPMLATRVPGYAQDQAAGRWAPVFTPTLRGRRALIVGTGDLGSAAARAARVLGMRTDGVRTRAEPHPDFDHVHAVAELDALLGQAEFVVLACPLTPATAGLLSRARMARMPRGGCVLNVGRGALLDQDALCDLLESGHLAGAILDVTTPEPPPPGHRLWGTRNLLITPHVSCDDPLTYNSASLEILFADLAAIARGEAPANLVDTARGY